MMNMKRLAKGLSLLLCLGIFVGMTTNNAWAKKSAADKLAKYEAEVAKTDTYGDCQIVHTIIKNYKSFGYDCQKEASAVNAHKSQMEAACASKASAVQSAQSNLDNICKIYKSIKDEFKKCNSGGMDKSKSAYSALGSAQKDLSTCQSGQQQALNKLEGALSTCESKQESALDKIEDGLKDCKSAHKAQAKADKANEKADKAVEENAQAQQALQEAEAAYNNAVKQCEEGNESACSQMKSLYKAYEKAAKKAGKTAKAEEKAFDKAEEKNEKAQNKQNETCSKNQVWNQYLQKCAWFSDTTSEEQDNTLVRSCAATGSQPTQSELAKCRSERKQAEEADRMNDYYQECIGEYGDGAPECDKFKSGGGSSQTPAADGGDGSNPLNGGSAGSTMGAYENANAKFVECQKLQGEAQEKCMAEYDAMVDESVSKGEIYEAVGNSKYKCPTLSGENLFDYLACRITGVVRDLRMIVYILATFGMVGFAYSAIIGKINWKQLANIAIGLFILSMTTSIIEYIAYGKDGHGTLLKYGNHLPNGNHAAFSQNMVAEAEFDEKSYDLSGLDALKSNAEGSSWSWKDLKSTIKSAKDAVDTAAKTYQTVKSTVETTVQAAKNISNAIKNGGNPLDVAATIASNVGDVTNSVNYAANMAASAASTISNDIRDAQSSGAQREYLDALRSEYDKLNKKCSKSATACNRSELDALARLKGEMDANTTGTDKWLNNQGQNVLNTIGNVNNIAQKAEKAGQAAQQGAGKGRNTANKAGLGGTLGDLLSFGYGVSEGVNAGKEGYNDLKENGSFDFRSQKTKDAEAEAAKAITDGAACKKAGGSMVNGACKCPEGRDMVNNKCQKIKGKKTK